MPFNNNKYPLASARLILPLLVMLLLNVSCINKNNPEQVTDLRSFQHGIDCIPLDNNKFALIFSSNGNPPHSSEDNTWQHDIYYAIITDTIPTNESYQTLIMANEAQEPASSAMTTDKHIMITTEDGWQTHNTIAQRYGVYDTNFNPIKPYPNMVEDGGHSGHVASVNNYFVIFYSEGWINNDGVDNLGTGDNVKLKTYTSQGVEIHKMDIAVGDSSRDWWPLLAGSNHYACLVWQRFVERQNDTDLMVSIYDPEKNLITQTIKLEEHVKYYSYNVIYMPEINRFLVTGTYSNNEGFCYLLDETGTITASHKHLPLGIIREAKPITRKLTNGTLIMAFPTPPNGINLLEVNNDNIVYLKNINVPQKWFTVGMDGFFTNDSTLSLIWLSSEGVKQTWIHPFANHY